MTDLKSLPFLFRSLSIAISVVVMVVASFAPPTQAANERTRNLVQKYVMSTYGVDTPVRRFGGDVTWSVAWGEDLSSADILAIFDGFDKLTSVKLRKANTESANLTIDYVNNVAFEAMTPDYRPQMQGDVADDVYVEMLNQVAENRKNLVSNFQTSDPDQTITFASALAEKHWAKRGAYIPPRRYLMQIIFFMLTGAQGGEAMGDSVQAVAPDLPELTELPVLDEALISVLYAHKNWNDLSTGRAREELIDAMMAYLHRTGREF